MIPVCWNCKDEYDPVEYVTVPQDPDEPHFCSYRCERSWADAEDAAQAYEDASLPAPLF